MVFKEYREKNLVILSVYIFKNNYIQFLLLLVKYGGGKDKRSI